MSYGSRHKKLEKELSYLHCSRPINKPSMEEMLVFVCWLVGLRCLCLNTSVASLQF